MIIWGRTRSSCARSRRPRGTARNGQPRDRRAKDRAMGTLADDKNTLHQIFPDGMIYAVSDCEWLRVAASYYGMLGVAVEDASKLPPDASVVLFLRHSLVSADLRKLFPQARDLLGPIA